MSERTVEYILIDTGSESNRAMMSDVGRMENATQITKTYEPKNLLIDKLIRLHFSYRIACHIDLPFKTIWNKYSVLLRMTKDNAKEYYIVVVNNAVHKFPRQLLNELSARENVHLISLLLDSFDKLPQKITKLIRKINFERIYTFQKSDSEKYGFLYTNQIYSKCRLPKLGNEDEKSDLYYIGADKGRMKFLYTVYKMAVAEGLKPDFTVVVPKNKIESYRADYPEIKFIYKRVGYKTILKGISRTRALLEVCQEGQDGLTMRFYEAIFYNKYLITNNITAKGHEYFNPDYMQVINRPVDIDFSRLKNSAEIDYKYDEGLSPRLFMEELPKYEG